MDKSRQNWQSVGSLSPLYFHGAPASTPKITEIRLAKSNCEFAMASYGEVSLLAESSSFVLNTNELTKQIESAAYQTQSQGRRISRRPVPHRTANDYSVILGVQSAALGSPKNRKQLAVNHPYEFQERDLAQDSLLPGSASSQPSSPPSPPSQCPPSSKASGLKRLGTGTLVIICIGIVVELGALAFLIYLWGAGQLNQAPDGSLAPPFWRTVVLRGWAIRAVTLTSVVLRQVMVLQAIVCVGMIAALLFENYHFRLVDAARLSTWRAVNGGPLDMLISTPSFLAWIHPACAGLVQCCWSILIYYPCLGYSDFGLVRRSNECLDFDGFYRRRESR
jgi:hypothetical protein